MCKSNTARLARKRFGVFLPLMLAKMFCFAPVCEVLAPTARGDVCRAARSAGRSCGSDGEIRELLR